MNKIFACRRLGANGRLRSTKHKRTCAFHKVVQHIYFLLGVHNESFHFKFQTGAIVNFMQSRIRNWFFYIYKTTLYFWWIWKEGRLTTFACLKHVKWFVIVIGNYALPFVATFTWTIFCQYRIHFKVCLPISIYANR